MYTKLTKVVKDESGRECVTCIGYGTPACHIHSGGIGCAQCPLMAAILNQLHTFEEIAAEAMEDSERNFNH